MEAYELYGPALVRKAERLLCNHDDALDLVQSLFADLWNQGEREPALGYLYRCVTNRCLNALRDRRNRERLLALQEPALRGPARIRCDDRALGLDLLVKLLAALDTTSQEILVSRYVDELDQAEIADLVGLSRKSVGKRLDKIHHLVRALAGEASEPVAVSGGAP